MPAGRPPKYETPEEMQMVIDDYFGSLGQDKPTISALAYALGMSTEALRNYEAKDEFLATVKRAKQKVEMALEQHLFSGAVTGAIFNLKNNFGWKDKSEVEQNTKLTVVEIQSDFD